MTDEQHSEGDEDESQPEASQKWRRHLKERSFAVNFDSFTLMVGFDFLAHVTKCIRFTGGMECQMNRRWIWTTCRPRGRTS
jgi:hypothetical protein